MFSQIIVGFGKAGRDLHLTCLRKARHRPNGTGLFADLVGIVDPLVACDVPLPGSSGLKTFATIEQARDSFDPHDTVVHICTGPSQHLTALRAAANVGYRRFVVEKPLTDDISELAEFLHLERTAGLQVAVVANWLPSPVTARLQSIITGGSLGVLEKMVIEQLKPRLTRTLANGSHQTAFDVEVPHQVALALVLGGAEVSVLHAECTDLTSASRAIPHMGSATLLMRHDSRTISLVRSHLGYPLRKRSVILNFERGVAIGYYPTTADDNHAWMKLYSSDGRLVKTEIFEDDPLSTCFIEYYRYFAGCGDRPRSSISFNARIVGIIGQAKALSGLVNPQITEAALLKGSDAWSVGGNSGVDSAPIGSDLAKELSAGIVC